MFGTVLLLTSFDRICRTGLSSVAQSGQHVREPHGVDSLDPHIGGPVPLQLCSSWHVPSTPLLVLQVLPCLSVLGQQTPLVFLSHTRSFSSFSPSFHSTVFLFKFSQMLFSTLKSGQLSCGMQFSFPSHSKADTARGDRNRSTSCTDAILISVLDPHVTPTVHCSETFTS